MIVAVCSDKGAPGVTTLATTLAMVWPGGGTVLEADPSGGDLTFWTRPAVPQGAQFLAAEPSVLTLAADIRTELAGRAASYAQLTTLGVGVIPGPLRAEAAAPMRSMWPMVANATANWPDLVVVDLGRCQPGHPAWSLAQAATVVLLVGRASVEGLYRLRERSAQLAAALGDSAQERNPVGVVVVTTPKERKDAIGQVEHMLQSAGSPIPVAGWMADDPAAVQALRAGVLTKRLGGSSLLRSVRELSGTMTSWWPALQGARQSTGQGQGQDPQAPGRSEDGPNGQYSAAPQGLSRTAPSFRPNQSDPSGQSYQPGGSQPPNQPPPRDRPLFAPPGGSS